MKLTEIRSKVGGLRDEITALVDADDAAWSALDDETRDALRARLEFAMTEFKTAKPELDAAETRAKEIDAIRATVTETTAGAQPSPQVIRTTNTDVDLAKASRSEIRDAALKIVESDGKALAPRQLDHVDALLRSRGGAADSNKIARMVVLTESEAYRSGWQKAVTGARHLTTEEADALAKYDEFRAANEGTGSAGGFGIPVLIDPSIILTSGAVDAPVLDISRVVTITTDAWKGVSSAAVSWSYDAEAAAVSDDTTTLAQPNIPVYAARGFIPYSIEIGQDYPGFAEEMSNLLGQGYVDLLASQTVVGSGSSSPRGIFVAASATTTNPAHLTVTTAGTIDGVSLRKTWAALPERFRGKATWLLSPQVDAQVRGLGNNLALADYTVNLLADGNSTLFGRPVVLSDYAPGFTGTTGQANYAVVGDFSTGFLIVQRAGMTVELVNHLFDTSTGRPTGQRGWFAWTRHGFDVVNANAFRLLANS
jgi:HK97 family phage major capsid protein